MGTRPSVFSYGNYRSFLQEYIQFLRAEGRYSNRAFAKEAGFKSHTFINLVISGKRNLSLKSLKKLSEALGLEPKEAKFFQLLVQFNQSDDLDEQNELFERLSGFARAELVKMENIDQYEIYSEWYHIPLLESLSVEWSLPNFYKLGSALGLRDYHVKASFELFKRLGLIEQDGERYRRREAALRTPPEVASMFVRNFHVAMNKVANEKIAKLPREEREISSLTLPLSPENFERFRLKLREFSNEMHELFTDDRNASAVYHFSLQLFPVMKLKD